MVVTGWVRTTKEGRLADAQARWVYRFNDEDQVVSARVEPGQAAAWCGGAGAAEAGRSPPAELAPQREVGVEDLAVVARRDHPGLVALPAVGRDARHPAAPVGLGQQRVGSAAQQRVQLDERAAHRRADRHGPARAALNGGQRLAHVDAVDGPVLDLRRVPEHLAERSRDPDRGDAVLDPRPHVPARQVLTVGREGEAG